MIKKLARCCLTNHSALTLISPCFRAHDKKLARCCLTNHSTPTLTSPCILAPVKKCARCYLTNHSALTSPYTRAPERDVVAAI